MKRLKDCVVCAIFGSLLGCLAIGSSQCWGQIIFFGTQSSDFNDPNNWSFPAAFPGQFESYLIQDNHTVIFSGGSTTLGGLTVSHDSFGSLVMTGGELTLLNQVETLEVGRERFPRGKQGDYDNSGFVDGGDFLVWQRQFGQEVFSFGDGADGDESGFVDEGDLTYWRDRIGLRTKGGEVLLTGNATLSTNGAAIGRRTKGYLSVGAAATLNVRGPISAGSTTIRSNDLEVGIYGPAYIAIDNEPGLEAEGIVEVSGAVNANSLLVNAFGGTGDFRLLPGGSVTLNGGVFLSRCDTQFFASRCGLIANPEPLMSSQLSITGSGGSFIVGKHDPNLSPPPGHDPGHRRDFRSGHPDNTTVTFTADAGGVTPIVMADNSPFPGELTGSVYLDGTVGNQPGTYAAMHLELDLDAYQGTEPLTLVDAPAGKLFGVFNPEITFLGTTTATVQYDYVQGDVVLVDFQRNNTAKIASLSGSSVPEPSAAAWVTTSVLLWGMCRRRTRKDA